MAQTEQNLVNNNDYVQQEIVLKAKLKEIKQIRSRREEIVIENETEELDAVTQASARELAVALLDRESVLRTAVTAALERLKDGSYGTCMRCERTIPARRLQVVPWAEYCVACQEEADAESRYGWDTGTTGWFSHPAPNQAA